MSSSNQDQEGSPGSGGQGSGQKPKERRRAHRVLLNLEVDYHREDTFLFAYITDLSVMGIFIRTNTPEPPGTALNLRFTLPGDQRPLELEGEVCWINPFRPGDFSNLNPGMGVKFIDMTDEQRRRIRHVVKTLAYLEDPASR